MVLYDNDGHPLMLHERYLEDEARKHANKNNYQDQGKDGGRLTRGTPPNKSKVKFRIYEQDFWSLYARVHVDGQTNQNAWVEAKRDVTYKPPGGAEFVELPNEGISKETLMACSGYAKQYFTLDRGQGLHALDPSKEFDDDSGEASDKKSGNEIAKTAGEDSNDFLPLPVQYWRKHVVDKYEERDDPHMAYITPRALGISIIPWLKEMEVYLEEKEAQPDTERVWSVVPSLQIPKGLRDKIKTYGAMLQLGLPRFIQKPLIKALCKQMYQRRLAECHLDQLEWRVARFHALTVPVLDPVISHLVGSYGQRTAHDRNHPDSRRTQSDDERADEHWSEDNRSDDDGPDGHGSQKSGPKGPKRKAQKPAAPAPEAHSSDDVDSEDDDSHDGKRNSRKRPAPNTKKRTAAKKTRTKPAAKRTKPNPPPVVTQPSSEKPSEPAKWSYESSSAPPKSQFLAYNYANAKRKKFPNDAVIVPPTLAVLGHSIRHWSGVRENGNTAAAHTGNPLNIGIERRIVRRASTDSLRLGPERRTNYTRNAVGSPGLGEEVGFRLSSPEEEDYRDLERDSPERIKTPVKNDNMGDGGGGANDGPSGKKSAGGQGGSDEKDDPTGGSEPTRDDVSSTHE